MPDRYQNTVYMGSSGRPYCRVEAVPGIDGPQGRGVRIIAVEESAKQSGVLVFSGPGARQLEQIIRRVRGQPDV